MDMICFCHIRWGFVYQRPQHLLNRFGIHNRVFVIEEPIFNSDKNKAELTRDGETTNVWVVTLEIDKNTQHSDTFGVLRGLLNEIISSERIGPFLLWYYSPMALQYSDHLDPALIIYDIMDELSAFKFAPPELSSLETILLSKADVVFTGGQSLFEAKKNLHNNIHAFPSSIDKIHFAKARLTIQDPVDQEHIPHPRFGFYGVIDERFDIDLLDELSTRKPEWHFILIGPVVKIDPDLLPRKPNIHYLGSKLYDQLPYYLSGFDIAILPFAINASTKFISPTKTPEYLAGGKPVISTPIADVVNPYGNYSLVKIAGTADEFILSADEIFSDLNKKEWLMRCDLFLSQNSWNETWHHMNALIDRALAKKKIRNPKRRKVYL